MLRRGRPCFLRCRLPGSKYTPTLPLKVGAVRGKVGCSENAGPAVYAEPASPSNFFSSSGLGFSRIYYPFFLKRRERRVRSFHAREEIRRNREFEMRRSCSGNFTTDICKKKKERKKSLCRAQPTSRRYSVLERERSPLTGRRVLRQAYDCSLLRFGAL